MGERVANEIRSGLKNAAGRVGNTSWRSDSIGIKAEPCGQG